MALSLLSTNFQFVSYWIYNDTHRFMVSLSIVLFILEMHMVWFLERIIFTIVLHRLKWSPSLDYVVGCGMLKDNFPIISLYQFKISVGRRGFWLGIYFTITYAKSAFTNVINIDFSKENHCLYTYTVAVFFPKKVL